MWRCTCTHTALKTDVHTPVCRRFLSLSCGRQLHVCGPHDGSVTYLSFFRCRLRFRLRGRCLAHPQVLPHGNRVGGDELRHGLPARLGQSAAAGEEGRLLPPEVHPCCGGHTAGKPRRLASAEPTRLLLQLVCCDSCVVTRVQGGTMMFLPAVDSVPRAMAFGVSFGIASGARQIVQAT